MFHRRLRAFLLIASISWILPPMLPAQAGAEAGWKRAFDHPVDWFLRTSSELLIVRSANSLIALEPSTGDVIWSVSDLEYEGSDTRGRNLLEIPGRSILLMNRVKLANQTGLSLLGLDLQTGKTLWQAAALDDFMEVLPMEANHYVLLITHKTDKLRKGAQIALHAADYYVAGPYAFRPVFTKLDPATGQMDWSAEFPSTMTPSDLDFALRDSVLCLNEYSELDHFRVACVDTKDGHQIWSTTKNTLRSRGVPPPMLIYKGMVFQASNGITALDLRTGRLLWRSPNLGKLYDLVLEQDVTLTAGDRGVAAFDPSTGQERWKLKTSGRVLNVVYWPEQSAIAFVDKRDLLIVRIHDGTILRKTAHHFGANPQVILPIGEHFALVLGEQNSVQYDLRSGEYVTSLPKADMAFPASDLAVRSGDFRNPLYVGPRRSVLPDVLRARPQNSETAGPTEDKTSSCWRFPQNFAFVFAAKRPNDSWAFWYFNPGRKEFVQVPGKGLRPDASLKLNRTYLIQRNELTSAPMSPN